MKMQSTSSASKKIYGRMVKAVISIVAALFSSTMVGFTTANEHTVPTIETINLTVTDCNVTVKTLSSNVIGANSAQVGFRYEIDETIHKLTATQNGSTMNIDLKSTEKSNSNQINMAIIFIPDQQYNKITVIGNHAGISLPSLNANTKITSNNGAMGLVVSKGFNNTIDFTSIGGSGSLALSSSADNYALNMKGESSAISVSPQLPKYTFQPNYKYVKGNGKAVINLNIIKSSFSIAVSDIEADKMDTITIKDKVYYRVDNENQLRLIGTKDYPLSANYMLNRDIDLKKPWTPIGKDDTVPFTGRFNGNGFTIKNVSVDDQEGSCKYVGFFGFVEGGKIQNVTLENVSIKTARTSDVVIAPKGSIAAVVLGGEITDCVVK